MGDIATLIALEYDIDRESVVEDIIELFSELAAHDVVKISESSSRLQ